MNRKQAVQQHAETTVKWAVDRLKQDFFTKDPNEILDIWLFKNEASYRKHRDFFSVIRLRRLTVITHRPTRR